MRAETYNSYEFIVNKAALPDYSKLSKESQLTTMTAFTKHGSHYLKKLTAPLTVRHCKDAILLDYAI